MSALPDINTLTGSGVSQGGFKAALALLWSWFQNRVIQLPDDYPTACTLPLAADRAGKLMAFDALGVVTAVPNTPATIVYNNSATPQDVFVRVDCTSANVTETLVAANDGSAKPTVFYKVDSTANVINVTDPTNGFVFVVDVQWQAIRVCPDSTANIWFKA